MLRKMFGLGSKVDPIPVNDPPPSVQNEFGFAVRPPNQWELQINTTYSKLNKFKEALAEDIRVSVISIN
jgi:hypothetical protein